MQIESVRMVSAWLADAVHGLNAVLATLPLDAGDSAPTAVAAIKHEFNDEAVAVHRLPDTALPIMALNVLDVEDITPQVSQEARDFTIAILLRYGIKHRSAAAALLDAAYTYRAAIRCLQEMHRPEHVADRTRNGVQLYACERLKIVPTVQPLENSLASGGIIATYTGRDYTLTP